MPQHEPAHDGSGAIEPDLLEMADNLAEGTARMASEIARLQRVIADLLRHVATAERRCTGPNCRQMIFIVHHWSSGADTPYNADGTSHFTTCVDREMFHKKKEKK